MDFLGYSVVRVAATVPMFTVLVTAVVLGVIRRDRLPGRARRLLIAGVVVLLVVELASVAWTLGFPQLVDSEWFRDGGFRRFSLLSFMVSLLLGAAYPIGIGLLVGAVLAGRRPADAPADPWGAWTPPTDGGPPPAVPHPAGPVPAADAARETPAAAAPGSAPDGPGGTPGGSVTPQPFSRPD